jgi:hypothetical protein
VTIDMNNTVLIALPAKDEEKKLGPVLDLIRRYFPGTDVLIVDDGSTDRTSEVARSHGALVLRHDRNYGYARALQSAREFALEKGYDHLVLCDADGQHEPQDIGRIIEALTAAGADYVIASRVLGSASPWGLVHPQVRTARVFPRRQPPLLPPLPDQDHGLELWFMAGTGGPCPSCPRFSGARTRSSTGGSTTSRSFHHGPPHGHRKSPAGSAKGPTTSRVFTATAALGRAVRIKDPMYILSWPVLFFRTVFRNIWSA